LCRISTCLADHEVFCMQKQQPINPFRKYPFFIRLLFPLIAGILIQHYYPLSPWFLLIVFIPGVLFIFCYGIPPARFFGLRWMSGLAIQIVFFSFGSILMYLHRDIPADQSYCFSSNQPNLLLLRLLSDPVQKKHSYKTVAQVSWLTRNQHCYYEKEKLFVYFKNKPGDPILTAGSIIIIRKPLQPIENSGFTDFDYKNYCRLRHIYAQVFLKENEYGLLAYEKENGIYSFLDSLRRKILIIIKKQIPRKSEDGFMEALMVGFTDDLDPKLLKSYADTGVIHIIAISGLHLALICHILQLGLGRLGKKSGSWLKFIVILAVLWGYALLSGASPSVIRAASMFSLVLFARIINREAVIFNTLAASAFLLACFDPFWIWDTGFQLSYAAVLSLCLFSNPIQALLPLKNKMLAAVWKAASVSLAAQILTTPVSIYYFHRFPTYFLFANLLAVPLSSGILVGGILLCCCFFLHPLAGGIGWLLGYLIRFLNGTIRHLSAWPGAIISPLSLDLPQLMGVYFLIYCGYQLCHYKQKYWFFMALCTVCVLLFKRWLW
jgi:competence protein ComEC